MRGPCLVCGLELAECEPSECDPRAGMHAWCQALHTGGHAWGYCSCTGYQGLSMRDAARVVVGLIRAEVAMDAVDGGMPTPTEQAAAWDAWTDE